MKHDFDGLFSVVNTQKKMEREVLSNVTTGTTAHMVAREEEDIFNFYPEESTPANKSEY